MVYSMHTARAEARIGVCVCVSGACMWLSVCLCLIASAFLLSPFTPPPILPMQPRTLSFHVQTAHRWRYRTLANTTRIACQANLQTTALLRCVCVSLMLSSVISEPSYYPKFKCTHARTHTHTHARTHTHAHTHMHAPSHVSCWFRYARRP